MVVEERSFRAHEPFSCEISKRDRRSTHLARTGHFRVDISVLVAGNTHHIGRDNFGNKVLQS
jgi:hypothetical protein